MQLPPAIAAAIEAGDTVVASSARAARALRRLHAEAQRGRGIEAWPSPDILDWDSWLNRLWQKQLRSGGETRLLLSTLQEQQVWVRQVRPSIEGRRLISVLGVAELAQQAYALLCAYRALDFLRGEQLGGPDVENFREWARGFERRCRTEDWLSRGRLPLVLQEAVVDGKLEAAGRLVLTGFDRITPAQEYLIEALRDRGQQMEMAPATGASPAQTVLLVEAADKRQEIDTCALWVRQELAAAAAQGRRARIGVVVPSVSKVRPEIERIFRKVLAPETVTIGVGNEPPAFEFSLGVSLADMPMARAALLLLRWINGPLAQEQASWLLLSGFVCQDGSELLPIAEFDARLRRQPMRQPELELSNFLSEARPPDKLRRRLQAGQRLLPQNVSLNFAEWVDLAGRILDAVHWPGAHPMQSDDFQVEARWSQLLDSVAALSFDGRRVDCSEFLEVLGRQATQTIFAPESRDAPVQILGPLEAAGLTFDALWFLGADDVSWPAAGQPHPFLTRSLQRKHGMPHADTTADWQLAEQVTIRLERSAAKCVFSYHSQNAEGACRPSTLVSSGRQRVKADDLRISLGADPSLCDEQELLLVVAEEEQAAIHPWPIEQDAGGAEILQRQAACPFQSFAARRLAARQMEETDWGLEARERGSVVHKILETLWAELKNRTGLVESRREGRLHALVEHHVIEALNKYRMQAANRSWTWAYLDAEQERIVSLIEEWLDYEEKRADFTVEAGEEKLSAAVGDLKLQLRVDRIDSVAGGRIIIDYKTGMLKANAWDGARPAEPQLPLYAAYGKVENLKGILLAGVRADGIKFLGRVEDANAVMPGNSKLAKPPYSAGMLQGWQQVLLDLGQQFLNGEAQVDPKDYPKTCQYCRLPGLCRVAESDRANTDNETDETDAD